MKNFIIKNLKKILSFLLKFRLFRFIFFLISDEVNNYTINSPDKDLKFFCPNYLIKYRIDTILSKEPDTITWIKKFKKKDIFYDIGANIGLYSCFAAKFGIKTFAFEPSIFNTETLVKNINLNNLNKLITLIPISLHKENLISSFKLSNIEKGGALSTFSEVYTHDGKKMHAEMAYDTTGMGLDKLKEIFNLPYPDHIKIDVDGIEHIILLGAENTLKKCNSILIEVNENFLDQYKEVIRILKKNNFKLTSKNLTSDSMFHNKTFNQIWEKTYN